METPQEYTARMLAQAAGQDPRTVLASTPTRLADLIGAASISRLLYIVRMHAGHDPNHLGQIERLLQQAD